MSTATHPVAHDAIEQLGHLEALDEPAQAIGKSVRNAIPAGPAKDAISGVWLGHALHPLLTDLPIGTWTSAVLLDWLGGAIFGERDAAAVLHDRLTHELATDNGRATLRVDVPFADRGELSLKKIGLEVVVRVGTQKRTIMLPPALAAYAARGARFDDGALEIVFEKLPDAAPASP